VHNLNLTAVADDLICEDPVFNLDDKFFLDREQAYDRAMEKSVHYIKKCRELNLQGLEKAILKS
jgi:hypothetical protein